MKNKKSNFKKKESLIITLFCVMLSLLFVPNVTAPPTPHSISGYIFLSNGSQVPLGVKYTLNDSTSGYYKQSQTSFPIPGRSGFYSETISGTDGDNVTITSWDAVTYGLTTVSLLGTMNGVNVTLNLSRSPEPTTNITFPEDNTIRNDSIYFIVSSNLTLYGNNATNCFAIISYSNTSLLSTYNNQNTTINLGNLNVGYSIIIDWNISGIGIGSSNVTINFTCDGMFGTKFETLNYTDTLINITIEDTTAPNISLFTPTTNQLINHQSILFNYSVLDLSDIANCSLYVDNSLLQTEILPAKNTMLSFTQTLSEGEHLWNISCTDNSPLKNIGYSETRNFSIDSIAPLIELISPLNSAAFSNNTINFTYRINESGSGIKNCSLYINGTRYYDDYGILNMVEISHSTTLLMGTYYFEVACYDNANNYNISPKNYFNVTDADLSISTNKINFIYTNLVDNATINISANISNIGNENASNIIVRFFFGDPDLGGVQIGTDHTINFLDFNSYTFVNESFNLMRGQNNIFVIIDPPLSTNGTIEESNESNNKANNSLFLTSYQTYYGNKSFSLALGKNSSIFIDWKTDISINILFTESGTNFDWIQLQALGRDINNNVATNDFSQADTALNLTGFYDSIYTTYTISGVPIKTLNFTVGGSNISNIPVVNSTINSNFETGILWDKSDGGTEYDGSQDLLFITKTNKAIGKYGTYDYEVKIPSTLRNYKLVSNQITIYTELI